MRRGLIILIGEVRCSEDCCTAHLLLWSMLGVTRRDRRLVSDEGKARRRSYRANSMVH